MACFQLTLLFIGDYGDPTNPSFATNPLPTFGVRRANLKHLWGDTDWCGINPIINTDLEFVYETLLIYF
jgi:hypothetical protein